MHERNKMSVNKQMSLLQTNKGTNAMDKQIMFKSLQIINFITFFQIHANCRIRRVYFSDRLYSEDELPAEFKLYLPVQNKAGPKQGGENFLHYLGIPYFIQGGQISLEALKTLEHPWNSGPDLEEFLKLALNSLSYLYSLRNFAEQFC